MSDDEYEDSLSEVEVLQARIFELEARLARQEQQSGASANNEALLGLASAALAEEGDKRGTVCDESVDGRSFPAPRLVSDDVTQPEVVVDTTVSAHLPAAVVASSSASAPEVVVVADICRTAYRSEVASEIESMSAARRPGRLKVRFDSVHCSDSSEPDSDIEGQYDRSRKSLGAIVHVRPREALVKLEREFIRGAGRATWTLPCRTGTFMVRRLAGTCG